MRVVSWNAQHGVPDPKGPPDLERALEPLSALGGEVYGLQELDAGFERTGWADQVAMAAAAVGATAFSVPALRRGAGTYGNALVVRGVIDDTEVLALPGPAEPRAAGLATVEVQGGTWSIAVTHLSTVDETAERQLVAVLDALDARPEPRVLLGDLNLEAAQVRPALLERGFQLAEGPPTWNARRRLRRRLDHVAVRGATVTASAVHKLPVSDHLAVSADLNRGAPGQRSSGSPLA